MLEVEEEKCKGPDAGRGLAASRKSVAEGETGKGEGLVARVGEVMLAQTLQFPYRLCKEFRSFF